MAKKVPGKHNSASSNGKRPAFFKKEEKDDDPPKPDERTKCALKGVLDRLPAGLPPNRIVLALKRTSDFNRSELTQDGKKIKFVSRFGYKAEHDEVGLRKLPTIT